MKYEKSCGAVIFRKTDVWNVLLIRHNKGRHVSFPKGHVEPGETESQTAEREIREETGVRARLYRDVPPVEDVYRLADGRTKKVTYYLARFDGDTLQPDPTQVDGAILLSMDKALATLSHASARKVLRKAAEKVLAIMRE